jgi:hypothetical protein
MDRTPSQSLVYDETSLTISRCLAALSTGASKDAVTADDFAMRYASEQFLRKYEGAADEVRLHSEAVAAFEKAEGAVRLVNNRIRSLALTGPALFCLDEARRKIKAVLGRFDLDEFASCCDWGPGATATLRSSEATLDQKILERQLSVSRQALPWARAMLQWDSHWFYARSGTFPSGAYSVTADNFLVTDSERFTTVPKDVTKRRPISVQATMNLFLQKGVGAMLRKRLKRVRVDLDDQSRNQWLASVAQRVGLATIDLASASDSISFELVRHLLPAEWFEVLRDLRHPSALVDGKVYHLEKFSAMGNGYTFELESLIFWALICAVEKRFGLSTIKGVYGDDLVVESSIASACIALLNEVGFSVNVHKTFIEGRFYESCGKHYFDGIDVTPPLQKEVICDLPSAIRAANRLYRFANRIGQGCVPDPRIYRPWSIAIGAARFHIDAINASRWIRAVERGVGPPSPLPLPLIPYWLDDDSGVLSPGPFFRRNGRVNFDRLTFEAISLDTDGLSLYSNYLRKGVQSELASYGFVNPRGQTRTRITKGYTLSVPTARWPESWPFPALAGPEL